MIVSRVQLEQIRSSRQRLRTLELPVKHGKLGELKCCPVRAGHTYVLRADHEYARLRQEAKQQLSPARGVLWLFDQLDHPQRTLQITVTAVERDQDVWRARFILGDRSLLDPPRLLAANPGGLESDYTATPGLAVPEEGEAISRALQDRYSDEGRQRDAQRLAALTLRAQDAIAAIAPYVTTKSAKRRVRDALHQVRALEQHDRVA